MQSFGIYNKTNLTVFEGVSHNIRIIHNVLATLMSVIGFLLNFVIILTIVRYRLYRQTVIVFILNLSILYCISSGVSLTYISYNSFTIYTNQPFSEKTCRGLGFITYATVGSELTALLLISFNRYTLIVHMDKYNKIYGKHRNVGIMLCASWMVYILLFMMPTTEVWGTMIYDKNRFICQPFLIGDSFSKFIAYFAAGTTMPPLIFCYIGIIWKVNSTKRKLNKVSDKNTTKRPMKMPFMIIAILTTFGVFYLPYIFVQGTDSNAEKYDIRVHIVTVYLAWAHLLFNPILYAIFNQHIQLALKKLFCLKAQSDSSGNTFNTLEVQINAHTIAK